MQSFTPSAEPSTGYCQNEPKLAPVSITSHLSEDAPADCGNGAKGAMFGVLLGAGCWTVIFGIVAILKH
jgi:hypothetical protein